MDCNLGGKERRFCTITLNINGTGVRQRKIALTNYSPYEIILSKNSHLKETSQLICFLNQLTGFYENFY